MTIEPSGLVPNRFKGWLIPAGLAAVSLALSLYRIDHLSLWFDEGLSYWSTRGTWLELFDSLATNDASMPFYYLLLKPWSAIGRSETVLRSLSAIAGAGAVVGTYALGKKLFGRAEGIVAGLLLAMNVFFIQFQQEVRGYTLVTLLVVASTYALVLAIEKGTRRSWLLYSSVAGLAAVTHAFSWFVILVHIGVTFVVARRRTLGLGRGIVFSGLGILAGAIVLLLPLARAAFAGRFDWIAPPGLSELTDLLGAFTIGEWGIRWVIFAVLLGAFAMAWPGLEREGSKRAEAGWRYGLVAAWFVVPIAGAFLLSTIRPVFVARYLIVAVPPLTLMLAIGFVRLRNRWVMAAVGVLLLAVLIARLDDYYTDSRKEQWRMVVTQVTQLSEPGDGLVFYHPAAAGVFAYYVERRDGWGDAPRFVYPRFEEGRLRGGGPVDRLVEAVSEGHPGLGTRLWVILSHNFGTEKTDESSNRLLEALDERFAPSFIRPFFGAEVRLYERL